MTLGDKVAEQLNRFSFSGLLSMAKPKFTVVENYMTDPNVVLITCTMQIADRTTGKKTPITIKRFAAPVDLVNELEFKAQIITWFKAFWAHEFNESMKYDNEFIVDMHGDLKDAPN